MFDVTRERDLSGKFAFHQVRVVCETHEEAAREVAEGNRLVVTGPHKYDIVTEGFDLSRMYWMYEANANEVISRACEE